MNTVEYRTLFAFQPRSTVSLHAIELISVWSHKSMIVQWTKETAIIS